VSRPVDSKRLNPRRTEIIEATLRLIARGGVNSVTHRAAADEAGVPLASTTYYFDSKSALIEEALQLMIVRSTEFVRRYTTVTGRLSRPELIDRIADFADAQINDPDALLTAQYELMLEAGRSEYLRPLAQRWNVVYLDAFEALVRSADIPRPLAATQVITCFVDGALVDYMTTSRSDFKDGYLRPLLTDLVTAWCRTKTDGNRGSPKP
jgi:TetR/AcrR family transcriptional regulator, regulator of biofilm formation and stress response